MIKSILSTVILVLLNICLYSQTGTNTKSSYISLNTGGFLPTKTQIESEQTGKVLEKYTTPGINFGLSYILEAKHLFYSGGLAARILPIGYRFTVKKEDRFDNGGLTFDYQDKTTDYYFNVLSIPLKLGYQTLENNAKQRFWVSMGVETNFTTEKSLGTGFLSSGNNPTLIDLEAETTNQVYPTFSLAGGISKVHKNGDYLKFGLEYNISNTNVINGNYIVNLKDRTINGTYRDTGTYIGFTFAYVFKLKK